MKDFLGKTLSVGDNVVAVRLHYRELVKCTIVALTAQKVRLLPIGAAVDERDPNYHTFLQHPSQIVFINR